MRRYALAFALLLVGAWALTAQSPPATGEAYTLTATVHAVNLKARTLEMLTGVGYAVRLVRMPVTPDCRIRVADTPAALKDLKPGQIVRARYRKAADRIVTESLETLEPQGPR